MHKDEIKKPKSVSSIDVAREAGVSQATVSYVLNNVQGVKIKPETREAVLRAAKKLNYYPNLIAKSMRLKKSMSIGVVSDKNVSNFMFMKVLEGIKDVLIPKNYSITLCFDKSQDMENAEYLKYYSSNRIDGIIFAFANVTDEQCAFLTENNIPFVIINNNARIETLNLVKTDMVNAVAEAVKHCRSKGADRIAYIGSGAKNECDRRFAGYMNAMKACGIDVDERLLYKWPGSEEEADVNFDSFFSQLDKIPSAVFCDTNNLGFRLLKYAAKNGIRIPDDMAVIAFGVSRFSELSYPSLSAIESPLYDLGFTGCQMLFDIMLGSPSSNIVVLEWMFVPRDSS